jgi:protocatechuate 3,4-dioxygenase beta subunit
MHKLSAFSRIVLAAATLLSSVAFAQERFGTINGMVTDPSNAAVPNAAITLVNKDINKTTRLVTNDEGSYMATDLEPGHYSVRAEATGFAVGQIADVYLLVGRTVKADVKLAVGATTETVMVSESAPLIDTTGNTVAHNVTAEEFDRLPKARTFQSLANVAPSVNSGQLDSNMQFVEY